MAISFRPALRVPATLALMLRVWGVQSSNLAAQCASPPTTPKFEEAETALVVNGETITHGEIERRARLLALSAKLDTQAKEAFNCLVREETTKDKLRSLQEEVLHSNPGKSREELIAIFQERQNELSIALQKHAIESALAPLLPKLRNDARKELIDERLKLQAARRLGIDVSDDEVRSLIDAVAARSKMTYEEFAQHLKGRGVDIATMIDKLRAQKAWDETLKRRKAN